jgi:hypothetical protein
MLYQKVFISSPSHIIIMKKIVSFLISLLWLQALGFAVPDTVMNGPYNISFDLGLPHDVYTVITKDPVVKESLIGAGSELYSSKIQNKTDTKRFAQIDVTRFETQNPLPSESDILILAKIVIREISGAKNVETLTRSIDGTTGGVVAMDLPVSNQYLRIYSSMYYPPKDSGYTYVIITSTYPWGETLQLFNTIHVEYTGSSTATQAIPATNRTHLLKA